MPFIKDFEITNARGLDLRNKQQRDEFLKKKIATFSEYCNYKDKNQLLSLLQEIISMYKHDTITATFDVADVNDILFFNIQEHKETMIAYYDIILLLGGVFLNVFDCPGNRLTGVEEGINGPISTAQMLTVAYKELEESKKDRTVPYGAN